MIKLNRLHSLILLAAILCVPAARGQQSGADKNPGSDKNDLREQPVAPSAAVMSSGGAGVSALDLPQAPSAEVQVAADDQPISGVKELTVGSNVGARNFLLPSISVVSQLGLSSSGSGLDHPTMSNYLLGSLDLNHVSDRSEVELHYSGGEMFSNYLNSAVQDLQFSYDYKWRRWSLLVGDEGNYLSESPFGFGGVGGLAFLDGIAQSGLGGPFFNSILTPNQTIPTIIVPRVSNTAVSQIEYTVSPRSTWTASGSFGTLNFLGAGFINSNQGQFQTGYNYSLSPESSVALIYRFDIFQYSQFPQRIQDHVAQLGYGRYVTGRLSFQVAAGPSFETMDGLVTSSVNRVSWAVDSSLNYQMDRTAFLLIYDHLVTGGSGVFVGAQTNQVEATVQRRLSPKWQASVSLGYATNRNLIPILTNLSGELPLNSWYAVARFNHQVRPGSSFFLSYGVRRQAVAVVGCVTLGCATNSIGHEFSAGFNFGLRPFIFR